MNAVVLESDAEAVQEERSIDLRGLLAAARRRRGLMLWILIVGIVIAVALALLLPPRYRSAGTILIQQQELPSDLVRSTVTSYADQRVQVISQRVLTTQALLGIIRRHGLYPGEEQRKPREELIEKMREDIQLSMISAPVIDPRSGAPRQANIAFSLAFTSRSPVQAMRVANELSTLFLNENLTSRTRTAEDASTFLRAEGDRLSTRIAELEAQLATFKEKNGEALPELAVTNMQLLDRTEQEMRQAESRESSLAQQKVYLESQLVQLKPNSVIMSDTGERILSPADRLKAAKSQLASARAIYAPDHPDLVRLQREVAGLERDGVDAGVDYNELRRRLEAAQGELGHARENYAAGHPDIQKLEREITGLKGELAREGTAPPAKKTVSEPDNPAFIQIKAQLDATLADLRSTRALTGQLHAQVDDYRRKINVQPQVEREYRELMRDYESAHLQYQQIRAKQMDAQVAQNLESDRKGERFELIEPPLQPTRPVSPNRPLVLTLGIVLAAGLAAGMAALSEKLDDRVYGGGDLARVFGPGLVAFVPRIHTARDRRRSRTRRTLWTFVLVLLVAGALAAVHFFLMPLDLAWYALLRRLDI